MCYLSYSAYFLSSVKLLKDISQRQRDSRQQKQVDLRRAYITARFTPATLPAFFSLGDQLDYGGFENRALEPGQEYVFFILVELNSTTGVKIMLFFYISIFSIPTNPSSLLSPLQAVTMCRDQYGCTAKTI